MVTGKGELIVIALLLLSTPLSTLYQGACGLTSSPSCALWTHHIVLGVVSRKSRKLFGPAQQFVKLQPAYSLTLFSSYVVKGIKIKITAKSRGSRRLRFENTKRILSPDMRPKSFGTIEKRAPRMLLLPELQELLGLAHPLFVFEVLCVPENSVVWWPPNEQDNPRKLCIGESWI